MDAAAVARADEEVGIGAHEVLGHADVDAVGEEAVGVRPEGLDVAEDVVPPAAVEADRVVPQLVEYLIHLEHRRERLDQHRRPNAPHLNPRKLLRSLEYVVPYLCLPV